MEENNQNQIDKHLDVPAEANTEKHIDFPDVEQENATNFVIHEPDKERPKDWEKGIEEGNEERSRSENPPSSDSPMRMDEDETIGIP